MSWDECSATLRTYESYAKDTEHNLWQFGCTSVQDAEALIKTRAEPTVLDMAPEAFEADIRKAVDATMQVISDIHGIWAPGSTFKLDGVETEVKHALETDGIPAFKETLLKVLLDMVTVEKAGVVVVSGKSGRREPFFKATSWHILNPAGECVASLAIGAGL